MITAVRSRVFSAPRSRGYTLIELLIIVALLGIAGALVIPSMTQGTTLQTQAGVRTMVSDLTFAQADAMAFQSRRVIVFGRVPEWDEASSRWVTVEGNGYTLYDVPSGAATLDLDNDVMWDPAERNERPLGRNFDNEDFGGATIQNADFNGDEWLIFDELGGPVTTLTSDDPGATGVVEVEGQGSLFRVEVETFTGRVTVTRVN